jgi:hypothetical protein
MPIQVVQIARPTTFTLHTGGSVQKEFHPSEDPMSREAALETSGQELRTSSFAAGFPERFSDALESAKGALEGIGSMSGAGEGMLDFDNLHRYHEIYRLRIELELETAAVLWRAAEAAWALLDVGEVLSRKLEGEQGAALTEGVIRRRASIVVPRPPFVEAETGGGVPEQPAPQQQAQHQPAQQPPPQPQQPAQPNPAPQQPPPPQQGAPPAGRHWKLSI